VRRVTEQDSGVYKCQAVNVVGNSSVKATRLNVTPGAHLDRGSVLVVFRPTFFCAEMMLIREMLYTVTCD